MQTFQRAEENGLGERPDALGVARLDPEVVDGVQVEVHDLVGESVAADGFHDPVVNRRVLVQSIEEDVSWINTGIPSGFDALLLQNAAKTQIFKKNQRFLFKAEMGLQ